MTNDPIVSIVVPCYNGDEFIKETLLSTVNQSYFNFEVLVINDGSTDNSIDVVNSVKDHRIKLFNKENSGVSDSRNFGLKRSKGDFIIFLDADDLLSEDFLKEAIKIFSSDNSIDFVTSKIKSINENGEIIKKQIELKGTFNNVQKDIVSFLPNISTCPSAYIYKKERLVKFNILFNKQLSSPADRFFLLEVGAKMKGAILKDSYMMYRVHPNSMSHLKSRKLVIDQENFLKHTLQENILKRKKDVSIFKRKLYYQLFVDFLKLKEPVKALKYGFRCLTYYI